MCALTQASTIVTDGLVSYWTLDRGHTFDRKTKDMWGNNEATIFGNPKFIPGHIRHALEFDGRGDYVNLTNLANFGSEMQGSTFETWVKVEKNEKRKYLFHIRDDCMQWFLRINNTLDKERDPISCGISFKMKGHVHGCQGLLFSFYSPKISDGKWHHVVYTNNIQTLNLPGLKDTHQYSIYIDGFLILDKERILSNPAKFIPFNGNIYLGARNNQGVADDFFIGAIDEVRIYNRSLSSEEVIQNYESKIGLVVKPVG